MLHLETLELHEITFDVYNHLLREQVKEERGTSLDGALASSHPKPGWTGFAALRSPLVYASFDALIRDAWDTLFVRRVSVRFQGTWQRFACRKQRDEPTIASCVGYADKVRFVYIGLNGPQDTNNEIRFSLVGGQAVSSRLEIPGMNRHLYTWVGGDFYYKSILGVLGPTPTLAAPPASRLPDPHPDRYRAR